MAVAEDAARKCARVRGSCLRKAVEPRPLPPTAFLGVLRSGARARSARARRVRIDVALDVDERTRKPTDLSGVIEALDPDVVVRRALGDERPDVDDGPRTIVLRTRPPKDEPRKPKRKKRRRRRGRGADDPPR